MNRQTSPSHHMRFKTSHFLYSLACICLLYAIFEYFFVSYGALSTDEFVFGRHIYEYTTKLPYRDFSPYKTVLGYYLLSMPMFFSKTLLNPLIYIKDEIALINTVCLMLSCYWASRIFNQQAVLVTLLAIIANQFFLIDATDLRVDMLTCWVCLFSALSVLQQRFRMGGGLMGLAFLISQKALWYLFAINGAMIICWAIFSSSVYNIRSLSSFNIVALLPIAIYIAFWSLISHPAIVLRSLFYEAYIQAGIVWYQEIYFTCWLTIFSQGPLLFLLWPFTFMSLFEKKPDQTTIERRVFSLSFASIALLLFILYKQPFPYNFVFTIPAFFLLYAAFISWLWMKRAPALYSIPLATIFVITGICYPGYISLLSSYQLDGHYQQTMIKLAEKLIERDGDYVSGIPFLYNKDQPIEGLKNLIGPEIEYLYTPKPELKPLLLASLYLAPATQGSILERFDKNRIKLIINNYRMLSLPPNIAAYIKHHYQHFYGSLYVYAPSILTTQRHFALIFSAPYRLETQAKYGVIIDGKRIYPEQIVHLQKGYHSSKTSKPFRLALIPDLDITQLDPHFQQDEWIRMTKRILM